MAKVDCGDLSKMVWDYLVFLMNNAEQVNPEQIESYPTLNFLMIGKKEGDS